MTRHQITIGENTFYIRRFEPFLALKVFGDMQKKLLAPLLAILEAQGNPSDVSAGVEALGKLADSLDGDALVKICKTLINSEYVSIQPEGAREPTKLTEGAINMHVSEVADILALCVEVVKVNYADFAKRVASLIGQAQAARLPDM